MDEFAEALETERLKPARRRDGLIEPMDLETRDRLVAEVMGKEPPPTIIPVLKKRGRYAR